MMNPRIRPLSDTESPNGARPVLEATQRAVGRVPNLHRTLAHSSDALRAYTDMASALADGRLDAKLRERIAVAAAAQNGCGYCAAAHTAIGKAVGLDDDELSRNLAGESSDPRSASALRLARAIIERRGDVSDAELAAARDAGFDDAELVEIAANVALNWFTNTFNRLARTDVDFPVVELATAS